MDIGEERTTPLEAPAAPWRSWRPGYRHYVLLLLMVVFAVQYLDRQIIVVLAEPLKREFRLTDSELGLLGGFVFSIPYSAMLLPVGMLVDRLNRRSLLAFALGIWSVMTLVTGLVRSLPQLILVRGIIAAAEATNSPAALSMLADLYGRKNRGTAVGIFYAGPAIATVLAFAAVGLIAERWGWRSAFFAAGLPGLLLALLLLFTTREPEREASAGVVDVPPPLHHTLSFIWRQRSACHLMAAMGLASMVNAGQIAWMAPLLMRLHGMSLVSAAVTISTAYGLVLAVGQLFGGAVVDRLAARDTAWIGRAAGLCAVASGFAMIGATLTSWTWVTIALMACWALPTGCQYGPVLGVLQGLVKPRMRGVANAIMGLLINLVGAGLGPLIVGGLSDVFAHFAGPRSIGWAMATLALLQFWAAGHFFASRQSLRGDLARVDEEIVLPR